MPHTLRKSRGQRLVHFVPTGDLYVSLCSEMTTDHVIVPFVLFGDLSVDST